MIEVDGVVPLKSSNRVLCDFDAAMDTDVGIYKYLSLNYSGSKYFKYGFNAAKDEAILIDTAIHRECINPIDAIVKDGVTEEESLELLEDIMTNEEIYQKVIELSKPTDVFRLVNMYVTMESGINTTILCRNEIEADRVKKLAPRVDTLIQPNRKKIDTSLYNAYFIKYYQSVLNFKKFSGNQVYLLEYPFNLEGPNKRTPLFAISFLINDQNIIKTLPPYINPKLPRG